jgi:hypothetical protein
LPVTASFEVGVGIGIGIGVDFCRSVFARFLANCIPSLAEFLVAKRHPDLLFDPDTDTDPDPDPDFIRFPLSFSCRQRPAYPDVNPLRVHGTDQALVRLLDLFLARRSKTRAPEDASLARRCATRRFTS